MVTLKLLIFFVLASPAYALELFGLENSPKHVITPIELSYGHEPDLSRALNEGTLDIEDTEAVRITFTDEKGITWILDVYQSKSRPNGPSVFIPHDNENESFQTAVRSLAEYGGHLLALECEEKRTCSGVDPNRYFDSRDQLYVATLLRFFLSKSYPIVTLHNNHDSHHLLGGDGSIYADMKTPYSDGHGFYFTGDADDLIIFSDTASMKESRLFKKFKDVFARRQLNFIFEEITPDNSLGGHMSTYALLHTSMAYFNIESQHGHASEQIFYLEELFEALSIRP